MMTTPSEQADALRQHIDLLLAPPHDTEPLAELVTKWSAVPGGLGVPQWLHICKFLARHPEHPRNALPWIVDEGCCQFRDVLNRRSNFYPPPMVRTDLGCARLADLAALSAGHPEVDPPSTAEEQLVLAWMQDDWPARPVWTMAALLVDSGTGTAREGQAAKIDFWLVDKPLQSKGAPHHLVRAPAFSLTQADAAFESSLEQVNQLLAHWLPDDAPAVAFSARCEANPSQHSPPWLVDIEGDSITVALAVGALWTLQQWLRTDRDGYEALADALCELHPERVVATAALHTMCPAGAADWSWPMLRRVGGFIHKLGLVDAWPDRVARTLRLFTAADQDAPGPHIRDPRHPENISLLQVLQDMAARCGRGMNQPQRMAYRLLLNRQEPNAGQWAAAAHAPQPEADLQPGLEAWLVQRLGLLCGTPPGSLGAMRRCTPPEAGLLFLREQSGPAEGGRLRLDQWLQGSAAVADVCLVTGPAMSGKSTLLAQWENHTARAALQRLQDRPGSASDEAGAEVCVPVDVPALLRACGRRPPTAQTIVRLLSDHLAIIAPWLDEAGALQQAQPRIQAPGAGRPIIWNSGVRRCPVRVRLWIDGVDGLTPPARRALMAWLAMQPSAHMLPPVLATRDAGIAIDLAEPGRSLAWAELSPWGAEDWRAYVGRPGDKAPAGLATPQQHTLAQRLGFLAPVDVPPTAFQRLCSVPGYLHGVCALLRAGVNAIPPTPGRLLLALLWTQLSSAALTAPQTLRQPAIWGEEAFRPDALALAARQGWPAAPLAASGLGRLLLHLARLCGEGDLVPEAHLFKADASARRPGQTALLDAAQHAGLVCIEGESPPRVRFALDAWHALFLAMARNGLQDAPDIDAHEPPESPAGSSHRLALPGLARVSALIPATDLRLPQVSPADAAGRLAADVADDPAPWVCRLTAINLPMAAQVAIDHEDRLRADRPDLVDTLRRLLLQRSQDASSVHASVACRLQAGLLLGRLGDTLRFAPGDHDDPLPGVPRLRGPHWRAIPGTKVRMAAMPVTQAEWDGFLASADAWNPDAACWQQAGDTAAAWLLAQLDQPGAQAMPGMGRGRWRGAWANPLLPVTDVSHHAAQAYVAWLRQHGVYASLCWGQPDLPTEWEWHLAAQRLPQGGHADADRFNHAGLRWHRPSPVGVFAADASLDGVTDLRGNVRQWCGSALGVMAMYQQPCTADNGSRAPGPRDTVAVRGSSYGQPADLCDPVRRQIAKPSQSADDLGLRLVLRAS